MRNGLRVLVLGALIGAGHVLPADEVLYWMVDNPTVTTGLGESYSAADYGSKFPITDARIAAFKTDFADAYAESRGNGTMAMPSGGEVVYLDLYFQDGTPPRWVVDPTLEPRVDSQFVENGVLGTDGDYAYAMASLGTLGDVDLSEYSFAIELGTWSDFEALDADWTLSAFSTIASYDKLADFRRTEISFQSEGIWNPTAYSAPEPTSGLLFMIGGALLALRRKRV